MYRTASYSPLPRADPDAHLHLEPLEHRQGNLFVVGMDEHQYDRLRVLDPTGNFQFHPLVPISAVRGVRKIALRHLLDEADEEVGSSSEPVDGILSFVDFPAVEVAAILTDWHGLPGATPEGVLQCNHRYWSRVLQRDAAPEATPAFEAADPFDRGAPRRIENHLDYPFSIKPLNGYRSHLAFQVESREDLERALEAIRKGIDRFARPLRQIMDLVAVPPEIRRLGATAVVAEERVSGDHCTLEGYVRDGIPHVYGMVDSVKDENRRALTRYEYPSRLPPQVRQRMETAAKAIMRRVSLGDSAFHIEFSHDSERDRIHVVEVNPRASQSHAELFQRVDGASNQKVPVELALGREPIMPYRQGTYARAGKFFLRESRDARVVRTPCAGEIERLEAEVPGSYIQVQVRRGDRLSELHDQHRDSYELAWIWVAGEDPMDLEEKYWSIARRLGLVLSYHPGHRPAPLLGQYDREELSREEARAVREHRAISGLVSTRERTWEPAEPTETQGSLP